MARQTDKQHKLSSIMNEGSLICEQTLANQLMAWLGHPIRCVRRSQARLHALKRTSARTPAIARPGQGARACAACRRAYAPVAQYHVTSGRLGGAPGSNPGVPRPDACSVVPRLASGPVLEPFHPQGNSPRPRHLWRQSKPPVSDGVREWPPNRVTDRRCCHYAPVRAPPPVSRRAHPISNGDKGMGSSL